MYYTVEQSFRRNGDRYLERAIAYASAQYPEHYYQGSMKKAFRWYKKADGFKINPNSIYYDLLNNMHDQISDSILYGQSYARIYKNGSTIEFVGLQNVIKDK